MAFIRLLVEAALIAYLPLSWLAPKYRPRYHLIFLTLIVFAGVVFLTSLAGINFNYSFWGNYERMDGIFSWLHFWLLIVIASSVFREKREWQKLFSISIVVALILSGYGFLQRLGVDHFGPWRIYDTNAGRITSTIGNPGFLAVYLLFHLALALNLIIDKTRRAWHRAAAVFSLTVLAVAFLMTGIRGAFLGLVAGLVFFAICYALWAERTRAKRWILSALVALFIIAGFLFIFRHASIVATNRLAGPYFSTSLSDPTIQTRIISWQGALSGVRENLWLGVGPQKFDVIFNKHFNPRFYSLVGTETWWDRAHNMVLEVLTTMGIIGLLSYLSVGLGVLYSLWRLGKARLEARLEAMIWASFFVAYFVQNLFVFDSTTSYLMLAITLAYVVSRSFESKTNWSDKIGRWCGRFRWPLFSPNAAWIWISCLAAFLAVSAIAYQTNIKLIKHNQLLLANLAKPESQPLSASIADYRKIFGLSDFDRREVAIKLGQFMSQYPFTHKMTADELRNGFGFTLKEMEKAIAKNPSDVRLLLSYGNTVNIYGELLKNSSSEASKMVLTKAERALLEAAALGQARQQVFYSLANTYLISGNTGKGIEVLENAAKIYEAAPTTYWLLSFAYLQAGEKDKAIAAADEALDKNYIFNDEKEANYIAPLYIEKKDYARLLRLYKQIAEQAPTGAAQARLAALYAQMGKKEEALSAAEEVVRRDPSLRDQVLEFVRQIQSGSKTDFLAE